MKILLVDDNYQFYAGENALLNRERNYLKQQGHQTYLFSWGKESFQSEGVTISREPSSRVASKMRKFFFPGKLGDEFKQVLDTFKPDVIHLHLVSKFPLAVYPYLNNYKTVQTLHGPSLFCATSWGCMKDGSPCPLGIGLKCRLNGCLKFYQTLPYLYLEKKLRKFLKNISLFHCPSRNIYGTAFRLGYRNLAYVPLGIGHVFEQKTINPHRQRKKDILFVGSMAEVKGIKYLYEAFKDVLKIHHDARLLMVGHGPYCKIISECIERDNLDDKVKVLGTVPPDEIANMCLSSSVMVVPSIWQEQFGMVGPEALSMELPVIGSLVGGIPEWLHHNEWGFLVPPRSVSDIAKHIIYLLNHPELIEKFGESGREFVLREYSNLRYLKNLCDLLENTAENKMYTKIN